MDCLTLFLTIPYFQLFILFPAYRMSDSEENDGEEIIHPPVPKKRKTWLQDGNVGLFHEHFSYNICVLISRY